MSPPVPFERMYTSHILRITQMAIRLGYTQDEFDVLMQSGRMEKRLKTALDEIRQEKQRAAQYPALYAAMTEPAYTE